MQCVQLFNGRVCGREVGWGGIVFDMICFFELCEFVDGVGCGSSAVLLEDGGRDGSAVEKTRDE